MKKLSLVLSCGLACASALLFACATDNGSAVHGPQFGPVPERDGAAAEGSVDDEGGTQKPDLDGGADADSAPSPPCTTGMVGVLAGTDSTLSAAVQLGDGAWNGVAVTGGAAKSAPSLVGFGTGFVGLTRGGSDALLSVTYGAAWSAATQVGTLTTTGAPALALLGANVEAALLSGAPDSNKFYRVENAGASWSTAADPIKAPADAQAFGPTAGALAAAGTDLVFAQDGSNEGLYVQTRTGGVWSSAAAITGAGTYANFVPPALAAVTGKFDLVLLYADKTAPHVIGYATRDATTKAWSTAQVTHALAQTAEPMSVTLLSPTTLLVAIRGNDGRPYTMTGTLAAASITWSAPVPLLADNSTVDSAPAVAKGICGNDAIAVFASGGQVKSAQLRGTAWSVPGAVTGASGSRVSVATR